MKWFFGLILLFVIGCTANIDRYGYLAIRKASQKEAALRVDQAFNNKQIRTKHAELICKKAIRYKNNYRVRDTIDEKYLSLISQYRFSHFSDKLKRENLSSNEIDTLGIEPNEKGEYIDVDLYIQRRLKNKNRHQIFGSKGNEIWYGGETKTDTSILDKIWKMLAENGYQENNYTWMEFGKLDSLDYDFVEVQDFTDESKNRINLNQKYYVNEIWNNSKSDIRPSVDDLLYIKKSDD